ncbi:F-box/WD repeat-containing protein 11 [Fusarium oxysporum f. sp. albedinis]|nr:F-box/WD repeat-containing protein 11 [Fusarium oxysporum f. sp. albedinis]
MTKSYFDAIRSERAYRSSFQAEPANDLTFSLSNLQTPASNWGREQLFTCRVVISPAQDTLLPGYKNDHIAIDHNISDDARRQIDNFLQGPDPKDLGQSEHYLVHTYGASLGQAWAALAAVKARRSGVADLDVIKDVTPTNNEGTPESKRLRYNTDCKDFVNSGTLQIGSSSPTSKLLGGTPDSSIGYVDQAPTRDLPLEDNTVRLTSCVMRHILYYTQLPGSTTIIEFRDTRQRMGLQILDLGGEVTAIDDGGFCLKVEEENGRFTVVRNMVALLEAKRNLKVIEGKPVISDECLSQMTCEAILARATDPLDEFQDESVTIVNATQNYVCFLQFDMKADYIEELRLGVTPSQSLRITATQWFDLSTRTGRECVLKNVCGLMALVKAPFDSESDSLAE